MLSLSSPFPQPKTRDQKFNALHITTTSAVIAPPSVTEPKSSSKYPPSFDEEDVVPDPTNTTPDALRVGRAPPFPWLSVATIPPTESVIVVPDPPLKSQSYRIGTCVGAVVGPCVGT
jgi:hypothetical protein